MTPAQRASVSLAPDDDRAHPGVVAFGLLAVLALGCALGWAYRGEDVRTVERRVVEERIVDGYTEPAHVPGPPRHVETCLSTMFGYEGDKWVGGVARCTGLPVDAHTLGIAHRTLPCGTMVRVVNERTGAAVAVPVIDRGPYGALLPDGSWVVKRTKADPGEWRGCADLTPRTGALVGHTGLQVVRLEVD